MTDESYIHKPGTLEPGSLESTDLSTDLISDIHDHQLQALRAAEREIAAEGSKYPPDIRLKAAVAYSLLGSSKAVADELGLPPGVVSDWVKRAAWWPTALAAARSFQDDRLKSRVVGLQQRLMSRLEEAIAEDPVFLTKKGDVVVGKHSIKDLAYAFSILGKEKDMMEKRTTVAATNTNAQAALNKLAGMLEQIGQNHATRIYDNPLQPVERVEEDGTT